MCNMEMGFCHRAVCMDVHIFFLSPLLAFTDSKRFKDDKTLSSVGTTLWWSQLWEKFEGELRFSKRELILKRVLVGGQRWECLRQCSHVLR